MRSLEIGKSGCIGNSRVKSVTILLNVPRNDCNWPSLPMVRSALDCPIMGSSKRSLVHTEGLQRDCDEEVCLLSPKEAGARGLPLWYVVLEMEPSYFRKTGSILAQYRPCDRWDVEGWDFRW